MSNPEITVVESETQNIVIITEVEDLSSSIITEESYIHIEQFDDFVFLEPDEQIYISTGERGPQGAPGLPGGTAFEFVAIASANLGGHRAVYYDSATTVAYADSSEVSQANHVVGITTGAALINDQITIKTLGIMDEPSWNWTPQESVFLASNGLLTQTIPSSGVSTRVGYAVSATKLFINPGESVVLE